MLLLLLSLPFLLGFVCGLRSMTGPALVCWSVHFGWPQGNGTQLAFLRNPIWLVVLTLMAIGELVADKLPFIPRRTMIGPLAVRFVSGALCGSALCVAIGADIDGDKWLPAIVAGAIAGTCAVAAAYGGYYLRRWLRSAAVCPICRLLW